MIAPTMMASIDARAMARAGSPPAPASGMMVAAIIGPKSRVRAQHRIRDGPNTAYPIKQRIEIYRPVTAGRPASSA